MQVIHLKDPLPNGFGSKDFDRANASLEEYQTVYDAITAGTAFVRFVDGDRNGSVARLAFDDMMRRDRPAIHPYRSPFYSDRDSITHKIEHTYFGCVATWDGRRNKVKLFLPDHETEILLDYDGPTVWEKFDTKAAKNEALKNPDQKDINGKVLSVGDLVLYINARYGSRMTLEEGTVVEFAASVNSKGHTITTIIESKTGEQSSLQYPESMVYKLC